MIYKKTQAVLLLVLLLLLCGCDIRTATTCTPVLPTATATGETNETIKQIARRNAPDAVFYSFSGIAQLSEQTRVAKEHLLISGKTVYRFDLQTAFPDGLNLQAVYTFPQAEAAIGCNRFYMFDDGEISGGIWLSDGNEYLMRQEYDGNTYQSAVVQYGEYLQNKAKFCFNGDVSFVSDDLFVSQNKLYLVSVPPKENYSQPDKLLAQCLDTSAMGKDEQIICLYNNHFIRTDRAIYVLPGKTILREDGSRVILNEYAPAVPVALLSAHTDEILFIGGPNLFLRDGTVIPMTALFPQYSDCSFGTWPTPDYIWQNS